MSEYITVADVMNAAVHFFVRLEASRIGEVWEHIESLYAFEKLLGTAN